MAGGNIENVKLPFKDPEALAVALENRSKNNLAFRVREISGSVTDNTTDKWAVLKSELGYVEERQIREALPESAVIFDEGMTDTEKKEANRVNQVVSGVAVGGAAIEGTMGKLDKGLSILEKVSKRWDGLEAALDKGMEEIESGNFRKAFSMFSLGFWGNYNPEKEKNAKKLAENPDNIKNAGELDIVKDIEYSISLKGLIGFSKEKKEQYNAFNILKFPQIRVSNFGKLKSLKQDGILESLGIKEPQDKKLLEKQVFEAIQLIVKKESLIENLIGKEKPNWREELSLEQILTRSHQYTAAYTSFENFSLSDFKDGKIPFGTFSLTEPKSDLKGKFDKLKNDENSKLRGVSEGFILNNILSDSTSRITDSNQLQVLQASLTSEKDKQFAEELVNFGKTMLEKIKTDFFLGDKEHKAEFDNYFNDRSLSSKEVFELYLITGGKTDISEINSFEKGLIYFKVWHFLGTRDGDVVLRGNTYNRVIIDDAIDYANKKSSSAINKLPEPFLEAFVSMVEHSRDAVLDKSWRVTTEVFSTLSFKEIAIVGGVTLATLYVLLKTGVVRNRVLGLSAGIAITSLVALVAFARQSHPDVINKKFSGMTDEEIAKLMQKEIESNLK